MTQEQATVLAEKAYAAKQEMDFFVKQALKLQKCSEAEAKEMYILTAISGVLELAQTLAKEVDQMQDNMQSLLDIIKKNIS